MATYSPLAITVGTVHMLHQPNACHSAWCCLGTRALACHNCANSSANSSSSPGSSASSSANAGACRSCGGIGVTGCISSGGASGSRGCGGKGELHLKVSRHLGVVKVFLQLVDTQPA